MNNNKRLLIYGSAAAGVLLIVIILLFSRLFTSSSEETQGAEGGNYIYRAVPSDAVLLCDFNKLEDLSPLLCDTSSFGYYLADRTNGLVKFQLKLLDRKELSGCPFLYSLHYSAKNSVSFLGVAYLPGVDDKEALTRDLVAGAIDKRKYNNAVIYSFLDGLHVSSYGDYLLTSTSAYVLESSVRHLENKTSILDNPDFAKLLKDRRSGALYVNNHQIGKFFSGTVRNGFLGYSDFFLHLSSWSFFQYEPEGKHLALKGYLPNNHDEKYFSTLFYEQIPRSAGLGEILPSGTLFAVSIPVYNTGAYLEGYRKFLEVHKKLGGYQYKQASVQGANAMTPLRWADSLRAEEIVSAYCSFGEKCEWITFIREKSSFGLNDLLSKVMDNEKTPKTEPYPYKGYAGAVFGEIFDHCTEEAYCKSGPWTVIGPAKIVEEFARGAANRFTLAEYMSQTPADHFLTREGSVKVVANLKEGGDSLLAMWKTYPRKRLENSLNNTNFGFVTLDLAPEGGKIKVDIDFYTHRLKELPRPKSRDGFAYGDTFMIDSTILLPRGPFELKDFTNGGKCYLEQTPNNSIRYMDGKKKGVWAIPFYTPICGAVEQADLFKNGKLQMIFASGNKIYALDRLGRFVRGYPVAVSKKILYGPKVFDIDNDRNYTVMVLNEDNSISQYRINGKKPEGWTDIKAEEYVKELPELLRAGGKNYWVVRTVLQTRIYTRQGKEITGKDKKRRIDPQSGLTPAKDGWLGFRDADGKEYLLNLENGKIKKM